MLRNNSMVLSHNYLGLYPCHCFSLLSLSNDVVLQTMCEIRRDYRYCDVVND